MGDSNRTDEPRDPEPDGPSELGWVRWGVTLAGVGLAVGTYGIVADDRAGLVERVKMGIVGLGGIGFALAMWVPPVARAFGYVLNKLR